MSVEAMKQALEALEHTSPLIDDVITAKASLRQAIEQYEKQKPWVWQQAPIKTQWGHDMVAAGRAIDKDHTVIIYCERDQTAKVEAMFRGTNT